MTADPLSERRQHDRITRAAETVADTTGAIGFPWRVEGLLQRLERHGDISRRDRLAGEEFGRLFHLAQLHPLKAATLQHRLPRRADASPASAFAQRQVTLALDTLGGLDSPSGACAWFILGLELSMRDWALREGWRGKPIRQEVAKGILLGTLGTLARHFGLTSYPK